MGSSPDKSRYRTSGTPVSDYTAIRPALAAKKIPWPGWHGFRRGLASNLHALGVEDLDIMKIMRHSDVNVTRASYIKVPDAAKKAAMRKLDAALSAKSNV